VESVTGLFTVYRCPLVSSSATVSRLWYLLKMQIEYPDIPSRGKQTLLVLVLFILSVFSRIFL